MSETTELMARAAQLTALALCGGLPVLPHGPHYDTCPACEPVRVAQGLADALAASRAQVEAMRTELLEAAGRETASRVFADKLAADLAADLAAVRKVERWVQRGNDLIGPEHLVVGLVAGRFGAFVRGTHTDDEFVASGRSLAGLGRALAALDGAA